MTQTEHTASFSALLVGLFIDGLYPHGEVFISSGFSALLVGLFIDGTHSRMDQSLVVVSVPSWLGCSLMAEVGSTEVGSTEVFQCPLGWAVH